MASGRIYPPDGLNRKVLFAVELVDPVTRSLVANGVQVRAAGLANRPLVNWSGRFVWLEEGDAWPGAISVVPQRVPFAEQQQAAPPRPADLSKATAAERLVRVILRPTPAYVFDAGVTVIRGRLLEGAQPGSPAVAGARVQLAWHDVRNDQWLPPPPQPMAGGAGQASPAEIETDAAGEFAVFLHLRPPKGTEPELDKKKGLLTVRLQVMRRNGPGVTRVTPPDFPFLGNAPAAVGCVPEGQLLARDLPVIWSQLAQLN